MDVHHPLTDDEVRVVVLEEGLRACLNLDAQRLAMLNEAVEWLEELTGLQKHEIRRDIAGHRAGQVGRNLDTIKAVRSLLNG